MKDLSNTNKSILLGKIKSFLSITWDDEDTDDKLTDFIVSSINRIDDICGVELDYVNDSDENEDEKYDKSYLNMCYLGRDLLKNRVFYLNEKALDDFEENYKRELVALYLQGKIYKANAEQQ